MWPRTLKSLGYATSYLGKWHAHPEYDPTAFGYDSYLPETAHSEVMTHYPDVCYTNGVWGETDPLPLAHSRTHWLAERAVRQLHHYAAQADRWHLRLDFSEPHLPCCPCEPYASAYHPEDIPPWPSFGDPLEHKPYIQRQMRVNWGLEGRGWDFWAPIVARYYAVISQLDDAIGRVLAALDTLGLGDDTLVIVTSDHGDLCGAHGMIDKHYVMYDDVLRVPLIVRWPGQVTAGGVCDALVSLLDLPATLWEVVGAAPPEGLHGRSLVPLFAGVTPTDWRDHVVASYNGQQFGLYTQRMIRTRGWKYIWNTTDIDELYDVHNDPAERTNLVHTPEHSDTLTRLRRQLYDTLQADGDRLLKGPWLRGQLLEGRKL